MKNVSIKVKRDTGLVELDKKDLGINYENLQGNISFLFKDTFVDGIGWLEVKMPDSTKGYFELTKEDETYSLPIKSALLAQEGKIYMQLRITEDENSDGIPIFKSNVFYLNVKEALNTTTEIPEEYPSWIDIANEKLNEFETAITQVEKLNISGERVSDGVEITFVDKQGETTKEKVNDGANALINGKTSIEIEAGTNITIEDTEKGIKINSSGGGGGGTSNYEDLSNKPKINNVELKGNKTLEDLGIEQDFVKDDNYVHTDNNYTTTEKNKLAGLSNYDDTEIKKEIAGKQDKGNYSIVTETGNNINLSIDSSTYVMTLQLRDKNNNVLSTGTIDLPLESVVVNGKYDSTTKKIILTLQNGNTIEFSVADLVSGLQSEITETNKLSYNLLKDTPSIPSALSELTSDENHRTVTDEEKTKWNSGSGGTSNFNELSNRPKYNGTEMTGNTDIPTVPTKTSELTNDSSFEVDTNKVTAIDSTSTDKQYPSAKAVYTMIGNVESILEILTTGSGV